MLFRTSLRLLVFSLELCFCLWNVSSFKCSFFCAEVAPVLRSVFEPSMLEPGSAVSLRCSAWGHPLPRITWSLDDLPVPDHPRFSVGDYVTTAHPEVVSFVNVTALRVEDGGTSLIHFAHTHRLHGKMSCLAVLFFEKSWRKLVFANNRR